MKYELQIIPEEELVIEKISGEITIVEMIEKTKTLFSNPDYNPLFVGVVDLRKGITKLSRVELYGFAQLINESDQFGKAPWAVLGADPLVIALSQVFQQRLSDPDMIGVFSTVGEAAKFLQKLSIKKYLAD